MLKIIQTFKVSLCPATTYREGSYSETLEPLDANREILMKTKTEVLEYIVFVKQEVTEMQHGHIVELYDENKDDFFKDIIAIAVCKFKAIVSDHEDHLHGDFLARVDQWSYIPFHFNSKGNVVFKYDHNS